jgi:crossover junction endodeoxyribonuclease RuvC
VVDQNAVRATPRDADGGPARDGIPGRLQLPHIASPSQNQAGTAASVIAIDIGVRGAIAFLTAKGELITVFDMPVLNDGPAGRGAVNAPLLAEIVFKSHATQAFIEFVGARPGEGAVGAFAFGRSRGICEGVLGAAGIPAQHIAPAAWKRTVGIKPGREGAKDAARAEAVRRWPSHASLFARVKDDGRAEAALIGVAGLLRQGGVK